MNQLTTKSSLILQMTSDEAISLHKRTEQRFSNGYKTTLPQIQSRKIAKSLQQQVASGHQRNYDNGMIRPVEDSSSGMLLCLSDQISNDSSTEPRNDE